MPLAEHLDSTKWSIISTTPVPTSDDVRLAAVGSSNPLDGWAVGTDSNLATGNVISVIEHFNGTSWTRLPSPSSKPFRADLVSVAAVSTTDAWAVGSGGRVRLSSTGTAPHVIDQKQGQFTVPATLRSPEAFFAVTRLA